MRKYFLAMYKLLIRPVLFSFHAEKAHNITFKLLLILSRIPGFLALFRSFFVVKDERLVRNFAGIKFSNPVGLAAGFDKDARLVDVWESLGFGFVEIGTITPQAQPGNPKPRLFRLPKNKALINRLGFNNEGAAAAVKRLKKYHGNIIVGGNIGKNKVTPNEEAVDDYLKSFDTLFDVVDYFVVNVSSPNTPGLRDLQEKEPLKKILTSLQRRNATKSNPKPILLKIAPDLTDTQLDDIIEIATDINLDGLIATNTTIERSGLDYSQAHLDEIGAGGLSGKPLLERSNTIISYLRRKLGPDFLIIGVGGIMSPQDAEDKLAAGANLIQLYTGFIYEGPSIVRRINKKLIKALNG